MTKDIATMGEGGREGTCSLLTLVLNFCGYPGAFKQSNISMWIQTIIFDISTSVILFCTIPDEES